MAKQSRYIKKEAKVRAPAELWDSFELIMKRRGCVTRSEQFREAMRDVVERIPNGIGMIHGSAYKI